MTVGDPKWLRKAEELASEFAKENSFVLAITERQLSASFEIGCLHALISFYRKQGYSATPAALTENNEFKYLTTPSGNPENYSYVKLAGKDGAFELRQQVRIQSHVDPHIAFTPDIVVLVAGSAIYKDKDKDFANGKRPFYRVSASSVVAAHECKSMNPFPELLVSFIGMLVAAHEWYPDEAQVTHTAEQGHLAPTLFIGGSPRAIHQRMVNAMATAYRLNIVCGLHEGTWSLKKARNRLLWSPKERFSLPASSISDDELPF